MRKYNFFKITMLIAIWLLAQPVLAEKIKGDNYWSVSFDQVTLDGAATFASINQKDDLSMLSANFAFGYRFNQFMSLEGNMSWFPLNRKLPSDTLVNKDEINLDSAHGLSARFDFPIYKKLSGFSQLSFNMIHFDIRGGKNLHDSGVGYSGGLEYDFKKGAIFLRYASLLDNENKQGSSDVRIEGLKAVGLGYKMDMPF